MVEAMDRTVADPSSVGVDPDRLDALLRRIRREVEDGPLPSAQVAVARHGRLVAAHTWGTAGPQTRYILQSVGRTVIAGAVWKLIGDGLLDISERVAAIVPEFAANDKGGVTVEHVLTHTAGFPLAPLGYPKMLDRDQRLAAFAKWRLDYEPGSRFQFHLTSAGWIVAELVERRAGTALSDYLRDQITGPLGLDSIELGVPVDRQTDSIAPMTATDRTGDDQEPDPWGPWYLADPRVLAAGDPSHAVVGNAADVALYFQALETSGLWSAEAVADGSRLRFAVIPQGAQGYGGGNRRTGMALFVTVAGPEAGSGLPSTGSQATFGNTGAAYQIGFMDPVSGVSFALLSNGYPLSGYDVSPGGTAMLKEIADQAANLVP